MTENEVKAMKAGNELDVLVATKVMGRTFPTVEEMKVISYKQWEDQPDCIHFFMGFDAWLENGEFKWKYNADAYSTNIGKTFEVTEKLAEKCGGDFGFSVFQRKSFAPKWRCTMTVEWTTFQLSVGACNTAAEAITKCALLASFDKGYKV